MILIYCTKAWQRPRSGLKPVVKNKMTIMENSKCVGEKKNDLKFYARACYDEVLTQDMVSLLTKGWHRSARKRSRMISLGTPQTQSQGNSATPFC